MYVRLRRLIALIALAGALFLGPAGIARAETMSPSASPSAGTSSANASPASTTDDSDGQIVETPDMVFDTTSTYLVLGGAAALALVAGLVVFLRR